MQNSGAITLQTQRLLHLPNRKSPQGILFHLIQICYDINSTEKNITLFNFFNNQNQIQKTYKFVNYNITCGDPLKCSANFKTFSCSCYWTTQKSQINEHMCLMPGVSHNSPHVMQKMENFLM